VGSSVQLLEPRTFGFGEEALYCVVLFRLSTFVAADQK
jgi:hypothetical protein